MITQAIFKRCGPVTQSSVKQTNGNGDVTVRLTFKQEKDAREAVRVFDKQVADGRTLGVRIVGGVNASLSGRLSIGVVDGSVDALMEADNGP
jgi:RNA recognition motif. (a.k.a. RRM, RBD, or RNP domain)